MGDDPRLTRAPWPRRRGHRTTLRWLLEPVVHRV